MIIVKYLNEFHVSFSRVDSAKNQNLANQIFVLGPGWGVGVGVHGYTKMFKNLCRKFYVRESDS
jgi:hypothetical protein